MRILWITHESSLSGANLCLVALVKGLKSKNVQSSIITNSFGPIINKIEPFCNKIYFEKYRWWTYNGINHWIKLYFIRNSIRNLISIWDILKVIKNENPDFVVTNTSVICSGAFAAWLAHKPHIWYVHEFGKEDHNFKYQYGRHITFRIIDLLSKRIITVSKILKEYLTALKINKNKIKVIYNGIKAPNIDKSEKKQDLIRIILIGRIAKGKNIEIAIKAMFELKNLEYKSIRLDIFGGINDLIYYEHLKQEINRLNLHNEVTFKGYTSQPLKELQNSNIVLINSYSEAFGRTTIEAMACKTLVIANNKGANKELIEDEINGIIYDGESVDSLVEKVIFAIKNPIVINKIIKTAYLYAKENFSEEKYVDDFYNELLKLYDEH